MNDSLYYLGYLVHVKNELNRKRRRFYNIANERKTIYKKRTAGTPNHYTMEFVKTVHVKHKSYTKAHAQAMYKQTKEEMKAMTAEMRRVRKLLGADLIWTNHGAIDRIEIGKQIFNKEAIERLAQCHHADSILLGPYVEPTT